MSLQERLGLSEDTLYLVDGHSFLYRAFYAYPDLARSDGFQTNALFIVLRLLLRLLKEEKPKHLAFLLDGKGPTFRHEIFPEYKAQRPAMPEALGKQIEPIKRAVELLGLKFLTLEGAEADDLIACFCDRFKERGPVVVLGSDKDLLQCLDHNVILWDPGARKEKITTLETFKQETGLSPSQWPDFQALVGDASDNIPGVPGVGPKTAMKVMARFPTLEALKKGLAELKPAERKKIEPVMDKVFTYRELTRLRTDFCPELGRKDFLCAPPDREGLRAFLEEYEFRSLLRELSAPKFEKVPAPKQSEQQMSLLSTPVRPAKPVRVHEAESADKLPLVRGRKVGLVPDGRGFFLGIGKEEWRYAGPVPDLARHLKDSDGLAVPCVRDLLVGHKAWWDIDTRAWFDLGLAAYLLSPEDRDYSWERVKRRLGPEVLESPVAGQGLTALGLGKGLKARLKTAGLLDLMRNLETPLIPVLARMEKQGVAIDRAAFLAFLNEVQVRLDELTLEIYKQAGQEFNLRSSKQLAEVLFEDLSLKPLSKTPGGEPSTSVDVLERLRGAHEVVGLILEFRKLEKLRSTYLEPIPKLVDEKDRIHTTFNQLATATGRLSSSNPNLQNIPIRGEMGPRMRACFIAEKGRLLAAADYSQIELRVLAHFSKEPALVQAFEKNQDIHAHTAGLLFDKPSKDVSPDERGLAKTINFGLIYGMGPQKMARELSITLNEAKKFIERYFSRLEGLKKFYESVEARAREKGFVITLAGRRRLLPDINSRNQHMQSTARRQAINTLIQGSAADIIKMAMLEVDGDKTLAGLDAKLILQVHDELLLEAPKDKAHDAGARLEKIMAGIYPLAVPLAVDWGVGKTWAEAH
ncbi:MAG: DNA polymerase I [Thermodesulfobacteriota bacterium]|nr:DNA polymerase I [Thermodesulfobacteriota bacterium]